MLSTVQDTWAECRAFVGDVCKGRPATHGLAHMEHVTHLALLIASLEGGLDAKALVDVTRVAMLHDVADHKYDLDGTLEPRVVAFIGKLYAGDEAAAQLCWAAIDAVSYSKENKRGMRYFEGALGPHWARVRDIVSDADKLLAIGEDGLERCWHFQIERRDGVRERAAKSGTPEAELPPHLTPAELVADVRQHADEKLLRLASEFIVTPGGKFLAAPKHAEMQAVLDAWVAAPPTTTAFAGLSKP